MNRLRPWHGVAFLLLVLAVLLTVLRTTAHVEVVLVNASDSSVTRVDLTGRDGVLCHHERIAAHAAEVCRARVSEDGTLVVSWEADGERFDAPTGLYTNGWARFSFRMELSPDGGVVATEVE